MCYIGMESTGMLKRGLRCMEDGGHVDVAKDKRIPAHVGLETYMLRRVSF